MKRRNSFFDQKDQWRISLDDPEAPMGQVNSSYVTDRIAARANLLVAGVDAVTDPAFSERYPNMSLPSVNLDAPDELLTLEHEQRLDVMWAGWVALSGGPSLEDYLLPKK